jgi:hypothetical protein
MSPELDVRRIVEFSATADPGPALSQVKKDLEDVVANRGVSASPICQPSLHRVTPHR